MRWYSATRTRCWSSSSPSMPTSARFPTPGPRAPVPVQEVLEAASRARRPRVRTPVRAMRGRPARGRTRRSARGASRSPPGAPRPRSIRRSLRPPTTSTAAAPAVRAAAGTSAALSPSRIDAQDADVVGQRDEPDGVERGVAAHLLGEQRRCGGRARGAADRAVRAGDRAPPRSARGRRSVAGPSPS